jgi:hypothetical protein
MRPRRLRSLRCEVPGRGPQGSLGLPPAHMPGLNDFDRYVDEHGIPSEHYPAAFALWIAEVTGGPVPKFEKVEREPPADGVAIEGDDL